MKQGPYRKLSEVLEDLKDEDISPDDVLINEDGIVEATPVFEKDED
jgi:hypothetical protein